MLRSPNRLIALGVGGALLLFGLIGVVVTVGMPFTDPTGVLLAGILPLNPLQSLIHVLLGAALLMGALSSTAAARRFNGVLGAVCLVLGLAGLFLVGSDLNVLAVNVVSNVVHFASAVLLLAAGVGTERPGSAAPDTAPAAGGS